MGFTDPRQDRRRRSHRRCNHAVAPRRPASKTKVLTSAACTVPKGKGGYRPECWSSRMGESREFAFPQISGGKLLSARANWPSRTWQSTSDPSFDPGKPSSFTTRAASCDGGS